MPVETIQDHVLLCTDLSSSLLLLPPTCSCPLNLGLPVSSHNPDPHRHDGRVHQPSGQPNPETSEVEAKIEGEEEAEPCPRQ
ncbi:hypothetical protein SCLCIDRAFT_1212878 [Scleroderma citrinum Foug A]|uniref:Uncharacterized protein n=1 Tax=Scleroderma citrinum Foug A TaxID=1036808 RepID=A0A0C3E8S7_9AGAM|nr:hypothetical protein SCLCIDRAFT_1212878 [Scleroderma citrinum Foug A]